MNWLLSIGILVFTAVFMIWRLERMIAAQVVAQVQTGPGAKQRHRTGR
ncbi:MAG: hypothetical protein OEZ04_09355 [Nitrospinota bacterium]|nr:hypothetical protein [Nitrospinota bacterium]